MSTILGKAIQKHAFRTCGPNGGVNTERAQECYVSFCYTHWNGSREKGQQARRIRIREVRLQGQTVNGDIFL